MLFSFVCEFVLVQNTSPKSGLAPLAIPRISSTGSEAEPERTEMPLHNAQCHATIRKGHARPASVAQIPTSDSARIHAIAVATWMPASNSEARAHYHQEHALWNQAQQKSCRA